MVKESQTSARATDGGNAPKAWTRPTTTSAAVKQRYNNVTYDLIRFNVSKGGKQAIQDAAAAAGLSMAAYITAAINAYAGRELIAPLAKNPYI